MRQFFVSIAKTFFEKRAKRILSKNKALAELLSKNTISTGAQYTDYLTLYLWVKINKPLEILEFGPGVTTLVMAQALLENGAGRITALESVEKYFNEEKKNIPHYLHKNIDLILVPSVKKQYGPFSGVGYSDIPDRPYDFIFVDGPQYERETEYDVDLLEVISKNKKPVSAIIDTRTGTCFVYNLVLGNKFHYDYFHRLGFINNATCDDLKPYSRIVAETMKKRSWRRWFSLILWARSFFL